MSDEKKPEQTPREIIAKLAAMSPNEFSDFMHQHFQRLCNHAPPKVETEVVPESSVRQSRMNRKAAEGGIRMWLMPYGCAGPAAYPVVKRGT